MANKRLLAGPGPEEKEQKTAAQLNDERNPDTMNISKSLYDFAETDDTPAIEQRIEQKEVKTPRHTGNNFNIDPSFEKEIHARDKAEHEARMKARAKAAAEQKEAQAQREQEVAKKLQEAQSLDPDEIKEDNLEEQRAENLDKLYPDPIPEQSDVEKALWQKRKEKGAQIAERAKLDSVYDGELHKGIITASIFGILGLVLQLVSDYTGSFFPSFIRVILFVASMIAYIYGYQCLKKVSKKYHNKKIPSDQESAFILASLLPFMALRTVIMGIFGGLSIPIVGGIIGTLLGVMIGSSLHYTFLNKFQIEASDKIVILNTSLYIFIAVLPNIIQYMNSPSTGSTEVLKGLGWLIQAAIFLIGERVAAKLALYTNK